MLWELSLHNDEAEELKAKIENAEKLINVRDNTQPTAETTINEALDKLKNQGSTLKIQSSFQDFNAPTDVSQGFMVFEATILSKDDEALAQTETISWILNWLTIKVDNSPLTLAGTMSQERPIINTWDLVNIDFANSNPDSVDYDYSNGIVKFTGKANGSANFTISADNAESVTIPITVSGISNTIKS